MTPLKIAVITGGHPFDVQPFHQLFRTLPGVDAYIQHSDEFASEPQEVRDSYAALVFYSMIKETPSDQAAWYAGKARSAYSRLGQTAQGIVLLHHAILAYPDWEVWDEISGMQTRKMRSYHPNETVLVEVTAEAHPVTRGLAPWEMIDETYRMDDAVLPGAEGGSQILLTTPCPQSMRPLAWTRRYGQARVFCFVSGHGAATYASPGFRQALAAGIHWTAAA